MATASRVVCFVLVASVTVFALGKEDFAKYEKKTVVLKDTLYSIDYAAPLALSNRTQRKVLGVTVVSQERGVYYGGKFINLGEFNDRDVEQLVTKVTSSGGRPGFLASVGSGGKNEMADGVREAKVLKFGAGSRMTVKKVEFDQRNKRAVIELYDEFTTRGDASTALTLEWTGDITAAQADSLIAKFLQL